MPLTWDDNLIIGIEEIDRQHKEIFSRFNSLSGSFQNGATTPDLKELLDFVDHHFKQHFPAEEAIMERYTYPRLQEHRGQHADFMNEMDSVRSRISREGESHELALLVDRKLIQWIVHHVKHSDLDMVNFIKAQAKELKSA